MIPVFILHALVCILLIVIILMQSGRRGGLTESMAAAESLFGAQTNAFMVKTTTVLAVFFLLTCLGLAFLSSKQNKSLMADRGAGLIPKAVNTQPGPSLPPAPVSPAVVPAPDAAPSLPAVDPAADQ